MDGDRDVERESEPKLETELKRARALDTGEIADAIESIGFECTRCGACCTSHATSDREENEREEHTATVFPDEVRNLRTAGDEWRDVARPIPYGLSEGPGPAGLEGETFEWALQTDACGDCVFYTEDGGTGECTAHANRPLICQTYPFSIALSGTYQLGDAVDREGLVRAHECEGLGRAIDRDDAEALAATLKQRAIRELEEAIAARETYEPTRPARGEIVVHDSEGAKHPDGTPR